METNPNETKEQVALPPNRSIDLNTITIPDEEQPLLDINGKTEDQIVTSLAEKLKAAFEEVLAQPSKEYTTRDVIKAYFPKLSTDEILAYALKGIDRHVENAADSLEKEAEKRERMKDDTHKAPPFIQHLAETLRNSGAEIHVMQLDLTPKNQNRPQFRSFGDLMAYIGRQ